MTLQELAALDPQHGDGWHVGNDHSSGETPADMKCDVCGTSEEYEDGDYIINVYTFGELDRAFCACCLGAAARINDPYATTHF